MIGSPDTRQISVPAWNIATDRHWGSPRQLVGRRQWPSFLACNWIFPGVETLQQNEHASAMHALELSLGDCAIRMATGCPSVLA